MNRETATMVDNVKTDAADRLDLAAWRSDGSVTPDLSAAPETIKRPQATNGPRTLGERIKGFFSGLVKGMEGDHDYHKYLGG